MNMNMNMYMYMYMYIEFLCSLVELSAPTSQHGVYEPAREVKDYAAFAPPTNGGRQMEMSPR